MIIDEFPGFRGISDVRRDLIFGWEGGEVVQSMRSRGKILSHGSEGGNGNEIKLGILSSLARSTAMSQKSA
jgi:hypothetical protein